MSRNYRESDEIRGMTRLMDVIEISNNNPELKALVSSITQNIYIVKTNSEAEIMSKKHDRTIVSSQGIIYYSNGTNKAYSQNLIPKIEDKSKILLSSDITIAETMNTADMKTTLVKLNEKLLNLNNNIA